MSTQNTPVLARNVTTRPYDRFMHLMALERARKLREQPNGNLIRIKTMVRSGIEMPVYPWKEMDLGDFFLAPIGSRSLQAMQTTFNQAAARNDFEISMLRCKDPKGKDCLRVTVSAMNVRAARQAAFDAGVIPNPPSDGKFKDRRAKQSRDRRAIIGYVPKSKDRKDVDSFWADAEDEEVKPVPVKINDVPTEGMTRQEKINRAFALAQGKR